LLLTSLPCCLLAAAVRGGGIVVLGHGS
jgi:hypothetical protein